MLSFWFGDNERCARFLEPWEAVLRNDVAQRRRRLRGQVLDAERVQQSCGEFAILEVTSYAKGRRH